MCFPGLRFLETHGFRKPAGSKGAPSDAVRARADAVRALEQPTASLVDQYGANTEPVEPTYMDAFWTLHDSLRAQNHRKPIAERCTCSSFSHGLYGPVRVQTSSKNRTTPHRGHTPSLIRIFAMCLIGKQGHKAPSYEQQSLIKLSWAHMPFRFCRAQVHISVVTYFHNNSLLACVETNRIQISCFEAMGNEKGRGYIQSTVNSQNTLNWLFTVNCQ